MTKTFIFTGLATALLATTAMVAQAKHHEKGEATHNEAHHAAGLDAVLDHDRRGDDKARDIYRHPEETLDFFQVKPGQTVAEYAPGGGWYTRILLPYISPNGTYVAINNDSGEKPNGWSKMFPEKAAAWTDVPAEKIAAYESDEVPEELKGKIDRVLIFRSMHGLLNGNIADSELRALRGILADDGLIGVVQHRANADAPYAMSNGSKGYLKQDTVVALFELNGFELVNFSEINANPKDTKDYPKGVWTLPPVLTNKEDGKAVYQAIGESDRMTLLFKKRP
ncbi:methyltransferase [Parasphingorhabdus sp. JC815]|uniref:class I SAM-dependent methyltransferase n=1 Tax=Parasphingorhabdus sp. JC815 TaxID=3232140 RepID=UPI0034580D71